MNMQKLTQKSIEALGAAQNLAAEHSHQQIEQQHLLLALLMKTQTVVALQNSVKRNLSQLFLLNQHWILTIRLKHDLNLLKT